MKAKPFVKWAGGKRNLLDQLEANLPPNFDELEDVTYIEPFVGGGAMLFHMLQNHHNITHAVINDINPDLIRCYELVKDEPETLIEFLKEYRDMYFEVPFDARDGVYYALRDRYNEDDVPANERAAIFMFLNKTCYNGLYRVNSQGNFNVPTGKYKIPKICDEETIWADHELLNDIDLTILNGNYADALGHRIVGHPTFVYIDPPYRPISVTSAFREYYNSPFGDAQQEELKQHCDILTAEGCQIMLSNSDSRNENGESYFEYLYEGYDFQRLLAPRYINALPDRRVRLFEVLIRNY